MKSKMFIPTLVIVIFALASIGLIAAFTTESPVTATAGQNETGEMKACEGEYKACGMAKKGCEIKQKSGCCSGCPKDAKAEMTESGDSAFKKMNFTLTGHDEKEYQLSDFAGKIVVLEWFNHSCPFVVPHYDNETMVTLANKYSGEDVAWMAINSTSTAPLSIDKEFARKYDLPYPILNDRTGEVGRMFGATNTPQIYVIDRTGEIVYNGPIDNAHRGVAPDEYNAYVDNVLNKLTSGQDVTPMKIKPVGCTVKYPK